jgi:hypothetical protein
MSEAAVSPPEELLTAPAGDTLEGLGGWLVVARNRRVNRDWEVLIDRSPENALRWYKYLRKRPTTRYPGRVFPLRGSAYRGAWECEVTGGDRVYYVPDDAAKKVVVYYAGSHSKSAPRP